MPIYKHLGGKKRSERAAGGGGVYVIYNVSLTCSLIAVFHIAMHGINRNLNYVYILSMCLLLAVFHIVMHGINRNLNYVYIVSVYEIYTVKIKQPDRRKN